MAGKVLKCIESCKNMFGGAETTESVMEVGGVVVGGTAAAAGAALNIKRKSSKSLASTKVQPTDDSKKPRKRLSRIRSYAKKKVTTCNKCINKFETKYPKCLTFILALNIILKLIFYWLDIASDVALTINLYKSTDRSIKFTTRV